MSSYDTLKTTASYVNIYSDMLINTVHCCLETKSQLSLLFPLDMVMCNNKNKLSLYNKCP